MLDFGTADAHSNYYSFADNNNWDAFTSYSMAKWIRRRGTWFTGTQRPAFAKKNGATQGWEIGQDSVTNNTLRVIHDATISSPMTTTFTLDTTESLIIVWSGTVLNFFKNNVAAGTPAFSTALTGHALALTWGVGQHFAANQGLAYAGGHLALWRNYQMTVAERTAYHGGGEMPNLTNLVFWCRGVLAATGELDEVTAQAATENGTVNVLVDPVDSFYQAPGGFSMFIANVLLPLFAPFLYGQSIGAALRYEPLPRLARLLNNRCVFDWTSKELADFCRAFDQRRLTLGS